MTIWRMRITCWIPKATNKHSQYVTLISFPLQTMLAQTGLNVTLYVHCLYCFNIMHHYSENCSFEMHYTLILSCEKASKKSYLIFPYWTTYFILFRNTVQQRSRCQTLSLSVRIMKKSKYGINLPLRNTHSQSSSNVIAT